MNLEKGDPSIIHSIRKESADPPKASHLTCCRKVNIAQLSDPSWDSLDSLYHEPQQSVSVIPKASQTKTFLSSDIFSLISQIQMESKCEGSDSVIGINLASGEL